MRVVGAISDAGADFNEDHIEYRQNFVLLLDGSTGLKKRLIKGYPSDAIWFVEQTANYVTEHLKDDSDTFQFIDDMIQYLKDSYEDLGLIGMDRVDIPSASMVLIRNRLDMIEIISLGDCTTIVEKKTGDFEVIHDDRVSVLDQKVVEKMLEISKEKNITIEEARNYVTDLLIANRMKKNTINGYAVLGLDQIPLDEMNIRRYHLTELLNICAYTDGIAEYYTDLGIVDSISIFYEKVQEIGISQIINNLREVENKDLNCIKHPRLKAKDDASIVLINFNE